MRSNCSSTISFSVRPMGFSNRCSMPNFMPNLPFSRRPPLASALALRRAHPEAVADHALGFLDDVADDLACRLDLSHQPGALAGGQERALRIEALGDAHVVHDAFSDRYRRLHGEGLDLLRFALPLFRVAVADGAGGLAGVAAGAGGVVVAGAD